MKLDVKKGEMLGERLSESGKLNPLFLFKDFHLYRFNSGIGYI
jgi:hypothetical protein